MLRISKMADYAILMVVFLYNNQRLCSATYLRDNIDLKLPTIRKILKILTSTKVLVSKRGIGGGYYLPKNVAEKISLVEIIELIDGKIAITECMSNTCKVKNCFMRPKWIGINNIVKTSLANYKLSSFIIDFDNKLIKIKK